MSTSKKPTALTDATLALFDRLVNEAGDWAGNPMVDVNVHDRGCLTHLKRRGLLGTFESDGEKFVTFSRAGRDLAIERGLPDPVE